MSPLIDWPPDGPLGDGPGTTPGGRGVRIAIIDSGVHAAHPHVGGGVAAGTGIDASGARHPDFVDRLGHGTAVAAAIREKAPEAEILIARVFERELSTTAQALVAAMDWAVEQGADLINLSLGTSNQAHATLLREALERAVAAGARVVAAGPHEGIVWLPGSLDGAIAVTLDWTLPRDRAVVERTDRMRVRASGYPRPIPGVPPERNLKGLSFAVANATGLLARAVRRGDGVSGDRLRS